MRSDPRHDRQPAPAVAAASQRLICLLLALVTLVIYCPVRRHGFILYDDGDYITQNHIVQQGLTWAGVKWAFTTFFASNWHPLTWLSHMLDCELFGLDPGAHHLVNVLFHAANAVLLFVLLVRLTGATWAAAMVAALFAWHPLRVESVAWAAERKDVLSSFFELLSLWCYTRHARENHARDFYLAVLCFALALLAKPMPVTLPCLLLVLDWWPLGRFARCDLRFAISTQSGKRRAVPEAGAPGFWRLLLEKWPFFLLAAGSCVMTFLAQRTASILSLEQYPWPLRIGNALLSYARYLLKTAWPADLAVMYPLPEHLSWLLVAASGAGLAGVSWLAWRTRQRQPYLLAGWLWYLGTLVPVIGLMQTGKQAMADRYSYFPVIGIFLAVVWLAKDIAAQFQIKGRTLAMGAGLILAASAWMTEQQLSYWRDDESLFAHAVAVTRDNAAAEINLGIALEQRGLLAEALVHYRAALRLAPDSVEAHNNLANFLDAAGQTGAALDLYQAALRLNPNAPLAHCNLGTLLLKLGRFDEAMRQYQEAARLQPDNPPPYYLMGKALLRHGQTAEAIGQFRHAVALDQNDLQSLAFLARILAADENPKNRDGAAAVALAERANILAGGTQPFILDILAMALAEEGRFNEAQLTARKAQDLAAAAKLPDMAASIRQHLHTYAGGLPYREAFTNSLPK